MELGGGDMTRRNWLNQAPDKNVDEGIIPPRCLRSITTSSIVARSTCRLLLCRNLICKIAISGPATFCCAFFFLSAIANLAGAVESVGYQNGSLLPLSQSDSESRGHSEGPTTDRKADLGQP